MSSAKMHCFGAGERWGEEEGAIKSSGALSLPGLGWQLVNRGRVMVSGFISWKQSCAGIVGCSWLEGGCLALER